MWNKHPIEDDLRLALNKQFGEEIGGSHFNKYIVARDYLVNNVYDEIKAKEPSLSDHGPNHIYDVLKNAKDLLSGDITKLSGMDLYCLCMMILFHDVGNIFGRKEHNTQITEIYNKVRNKDPRFNQERRVVIKGAEAHCGRTNTGSRDTLACVEETESIDGAKINLREMAAILRFADELAEGPQRTSNYMLESGRYEESSRIFHKYASITNVFIDKGNSRIVLYYYIDINKDDLQNPKDISDLIHFIFERINKLDEERRYNKYYTPLLNDFKKTEVTLNFSYDGMPVEGLDSIKCTLNDLYPIPGSNQKSGEEILNSICSELEIDKLIQKIKDHEAV
ncbi:HD domain-containing protein [Pararcticibacter amylolyticus]|uniref:HD-CE domain-containing protein n=1 Tax=Pararcticibacter amylolyticus TaxID=2173175 RepID=A0A2U2PD23_9SPHI|nr:hypothetical protein [Pararcticibacter amylolyticus]PWG79287.1 hypothetical protein DDR33_17340 [Pararcticibacter amylolyticus]